MRKNVFIRTDDLLNDCSVILYTVCCLNVKWYYFQFYCYQHRLRVSHCVSHVVSQHRVSHRVSSFKIKTHQRIRFLQFVLFFVAYVQIGSASDNCLDDCVGVCVVIFHDSPILSLFFHSFLLWASFQRLQSE